MTLSIRTLSALAFDRGEDFDPAQPATAALLDDLHLVAHATAVIPDAGPVERRRQRDRARRRAAPTIPEWFSLEDLLSPPWEPSNAHHELI